MAIHANSLARSGNPLALGNARMDQKVHMAIPVCGRSLCCAFIPHANVHTHSQSLGRPLHEPLKCPLTPPLGQSAEGDRHLRRGADMNSDRPAKIAKRLGIGLKALRLWEAEGLIKPHRLANGWRVFRDEDITAAWRIAALKQLGFSLSAIKALLSRGTPSLDVILSVQERALNEQALQIQRAQKAIQAAREKLAGGAHLDADALIILHQETNMSTNFINPTTEKLWESTFSPEQIHTLKERPFTPEEQERVGAAWASVITEADRLRVIGDPASEAALALGRRWFSLVREFTRSDPGMIASSRDFYAQGFADPTTASQMPFDKGVWDFIHKVAEQLVARGEAIT